jgi:hypothetical protein
MNETSVLRIRSSDISEVKESEFGYEKIISPQVQRSETLPEFAVPPGKRIRLDPGQIKRMNREASRKISAKAKEAFIEERNALVKKKFKKGLSREEERRLRFVRWQLDRIDDAEAGEHLDRLEKFAEYYEDVTREIKMLLGQLGGVRGTRKRSRRGRKHR